MAAPPPVPGLFRKYTGRKILILISELKYFLKLESRVVHGLRRPCIFSKHLEEVFSECWEILLAVPHITTTAIVYL